MEEAPVYSEKGQALVLSRTEEVSAGLFLLAPLPAAHKQWCFAGGGRPCSRSGSQPSPSPAAPAVLGR